MRILPPITTKLTTLHSGWIVGSAANFDKDMKNIKDIDVLIPFNNWKEAAALIPAEAHPNTFGGWSFRDNQILIDVWPGDLAWFLTNSMANYAWHPQSGSLFKRITAQDENSLHPYGMSYGLYNV
jgi:hypothetical protein